MHRSRVGAHCRARACRDSAGESNSSNNNNNDNNNNDNSTNNDDNSIVIKVIVIVIMIIVLVIMIRTIIVNTSSRRRGPPSWEPCPQRRPERPRAAPTPLLTARSPSLTSDENEYNNNDNGSAVKA